MLLALAHLALADELPQMSNGSGSPIHWVAMPIAFTVDATNEAGLDAERVVVSVAQGASAWNDIQDSSVALRFMGTAKGLTMAHDEVNGVTFNADWDLDEDMLAVTSVWTTADGVALGFDMQVNTKDHRWALDGAEDSVDLQNAMAHEFGHVLGIGHLDKNPDATMYPSSSDGETLKRDLTEDDRWVAMNFYPPGMGGPEPAATGPTLCSTTNPSATTPLMLAGVAALALFRRKERA